MIVVAAAYTMNLAVQEVVRTRDWMALLYQGHSDGRLPIMMDFHDSARVDRPPTADIITAHQQHSGSNDIMDIAALVSADDPGHVADLMANQQQQPSRTDDDDDDIDINDYYKSNTHDNQVKIPTPHSNSRATSTSVTGPAAWLLRALQVALSETILMLAGHSWVMVLSEPSLRGSAFGELTSGVTAGRGSTEAAVALVVFELAGPDMPDKLLQGNTLTLILLFALVLLTCLDLESEAIKRASNPQIRLALHAVLSKNKVRFENLRAITCLQTASN